MYFDRLPTELEEIKGRFNSFIVTAFDDSMTVEMQMRAIIKYIKKHYELTNEMVQYLDDFIKKFDKNLYNTLYDVIQAWYKSGILTDMINESIALYNKRGEEFLNKLRAEIKDSVFYNGLWGGKVQKPCITIIDDDGRAEFYHRFKPLMKKYKVGFTSALIGSRGFGNGYLTREQISELQSDFGCEFVSHGWLHDINKKPYTMTASELDEDLRKGKEFIQSVNGNDEIYVVPFGTNTPSQRKIAMRYFKANILTTGEYTPDGHYNEMPVDNFRLIRISSNADFDYIRNKILEAKTKNGWVIIMSHIDEATTGHVERTQKIDDILSLAFSSGFEYCNVSEGLNKFGMLSRFDDDNYVDANGNIYGQLLNGFDVNNMTGFSLEQPITDFPVNKVTGIKINQTEANKYGLQRAGVVLTHRDREVEFSYQLYIARSGGSGNRIYTRWFDRNTNKWSDFVDTSHAIVENRGGFYKPNAPLTDFPIDRLVTIKVPNIEASSYGLNVGGVITTFRSNEAFYSYQHYIMSNGRIEMKRFWDSKGNKWGDWLSPQPYFNNDYKRLIPETTIKAGGTYNISTASNLKQDMMLLAMPQTTVETGIVWNVYVGSDGSYTLRLCNVSNSDVTMKERLWLFKKIE